MCYEMGLKPNEVKSLYLRDFNLMVTGYFRRQEKEWDRARHIMWATMNFGGMGLQNPVTPQEIRPLNLDTENELKMITTMKMAMDLLNDFMAD